MKTKKKVVKTTKKAVKKKKTAKKTTKKTKLGQGLLNGLTEAVDSKHATDALRYVLGPKDLEVTVADYDESIANESTSSLSAVLPSEDGEVKTSETLAQAVVTATQGMQNEAYLNQVNEALQKLMDKMDKNGGSKIVLKELTFKEKLSNFVLSNNMGLALAIIAVLLGIVLPLYLALK